MTGSTRVRASRELFDTSKAAAGQPTPACPDASWRCPVNGTTVIVLPAVYAAVRAAPQNCSLVRGTVLCGCHVLDAAVYTAVTSSACVHTCSSPCPDCAGGATEALADFRGPVQPPSCPAVPDPGCTRWQYACGSQNQFRVSAGQYAALRAQQSCSSDLDFSSCVVGR